MEESVKNNFGYPSKSCCDVCGGFKNNQVEPRFLYTVCEDHQDVLPVKVGELRYQKNKSKT